MGSPASPVLANLWLSQFEYVFKNRKVKLFRRYVDDIICVIKKNELDGTLEQINSLHANLKFTCEMESTKGQIAFLGMLLTHEGNSIQSQWFTKPSSSVLMMNFYSLAPSRYKRSVERSMVYRIFNSC